MSKRQEMYKAHGPRVWDYYAKQQKFKQVKDRMDEIKKDFKDVMDDLFDGAKKKSLTFENLDLDNGDKVRVTLVEPTSIVWDVEKFKKRLTPAIQRQVINKEYTIVNMPGLIEYLRSCGVNPNKFKSYLTVTESVNEQAVDQLSDLGKITVDQINGVYDIEISTPYYKTSYIKAPEPKE